jgi:VanZ family protein
MKLLLGKYLITKWPAIIWSVIVFILLVLPPLNIAKETQLTITHFDKVIHFLLFGILVFLWGTYLKTQFQLSKKFNLQLFIVFLLATGYGIVMEFVQLKVSRDFDVWDMLADAVGAFTAWLYFFIKNKPRWKPGP